jgi:hypothetical protein
MVGSCLAPLIIGNSPQFRPDPLAGGIVTQVVHFAYHTGNGQVAGMASRSNRKEFRTSVILTEGQFKQVREIAEANDASIAWVLRQAVDRYLEAATSMNRDGKPPAPTQMR